MLFCQTAHAPAKCICIATIEFYRIVSEYQTQASASVSSSLWLLDKYNKNTIYYYLFGIYYLWKIMIQWQFKGFVMPLMCHNRPYLLLPNWSQSAAPDVSVFHWFVIVYIHYFTWKSFDIFFGRLLKVIFEDATLISHRPERLHIWRGCESCGSAVSRKDERRWVAWGP